MKLRVLAMFTALFSSLAAQGADEIRIGTATAFAPRPGRPATANVKIYLRDLSGTPLDRWNAAPNRVQGVTFRIAPSPLSAVSTMSATRVGPCAAQAPYFEYQVDDHAGITGTFGYVFQFNPANPPIALNQDAAAPGDHCVTLTVGVVSGFSGTITLTLDPSVFGTALVGGDGMVEENVENGQLVLIPGSIYVP